MSDDEILDDVFDEEEEEFEDNGEIDLPSPTKTTAPSNYQTYIFVAKGDLKEETPFVKLRHPHTGLESLYIVNENGELLALERFNGDQASWFINNRTVKDGYLYMTSPIDPLFWILDRLDSLRKKTLEHEGVFLSLDDIYYDSGFECLRSLCDISIFCDIREMDDQKYFRLNDHKVQEWLKRKVDAICDYLVNMPDVVNLMKVRAASSKGREGDALSEDELLILAIGFLGDMVQPHRIDALKAFYEIQADIVKFFVDPEEPSNPKKRKRSLSKKVETPKTPKKSKQQQNIEKVNKKGMASITSFFKMA